MNLLIDTDMLHDITAVFAAISHLPKGFLGEVRGFARLTTRKSFKKKG